MLSDDFDVLEEVKNHFEQQESQSIYEIFWTIGMQYFTIKYTYGAGSVDDFIERCIENGGKEVNEKLSKLQNKLEKLDVKQPAWMVMLKYDLTVEEVKEKSLTEFYLLAKSTEREVTRYAKEFMERWLNDGFRN